MSHKSVTIAVPIYGDLPSLKHCIESLKEHVDTTNHQILLVNDNGPGADQIEEYLKEATRGKKGFIYHRNPGNLGFVKTCNKIASELDESGNDILFLNSDTVVTEGFLGGLINTLYAEDSIGIVSPRSNNATIATIPLLAAYQRGGTTPDKSYKAFCALKQHLPRYQIAPVAHGFCMLISRSIIDQHGLFDEVFERGYGEEIDFCMRIKDYGYQSALCNWAYVFHEEARSFSSKEKQKILKKNHHIITDRYPEYDEIIDSYAYEAIQKELKILRELGMPASYFERNPFKRAAKYAINKLARA